MLKFDIIKKIGFTEDIAKDLEKEYNVSLILIGIKEIDLMWKKIGTDRNNGKGHDDWSKCTVHKKMLA